MTQQNNPFTTTTRTRILEARKRTIATQKPYRLTVLDGPSSGFTDTFTLDAVSIGSSRANKFRIEDTSVSRHHARIDVDGQGLLLRDLGSTNGTRINGVLVQAAPLPAKAVLEFGAVKVNFALENYDEEIPLHSESHFGQAIGESVAMRRLFAQLKTVANSEATVLLEGESGTGKEILAEAIHEASPRADAPFVVVDCGALPATLIEAELFGHEKGAFTGAANRRIGAFEQADGGTLFLDEIGELDVSLQPRLLRVLENRAIKRVGSSEYVQIDVRIVAATNRILENLVGSGDFREDLFHRLSVLAFKVPPLRQRPGDATLLAQRFVAEFHDQNPTAPMFVPDEEFYRVIEKRQWPGNIRELRNFVERAVILSSVGDSPVLSDSGLLAHGEIEVTDTSPRPDTVIDDLYTLPYPEAKEAMVDQFERTYLENALAARDWNVARTARECHINRGYLFRLIRKHDLRR